MNSLISSKCLTVAAILWVSTSTNAQQGEPRPASAESASSQAASKVRLPREVTAALERVDLCIHFAGEINGDRSERDREVNEALRRNRCDTIEPTIQKLKRKYKTNKVALPKLEAAENSLNQ